MGQEQGKDKKIGREPSCHSANKSFALCLQPPPQQSEAVGQKDVGATESGMSQQVHEIQPEVLALQILL